MKNSYSKKTKYRIGDMFTANFPWESQEVWSELHGFIPEGIHRGDSLLVLQVVDKRLKVLTPGGTVGWVSMNIFEME